MWGGWGESWGKRGCEGLRRVWGLGRHGGPGAGIDVGLWGPWVCGAGAGAGVWLWELGGSWRECGAVRAWCRCGTVRV